MAGIGGKQTLAFAPSANCANGHKGGENDNDRRQQKRDMSPPQTFGAGCWVTVKAGAIDNQCHNTGECREKATVTIATAQTVVAVIHLAMIT